MNDTGVGGVATRHLEAAVAGDKTARPPRHAIRIIKSVLKRRIQHSLPRLSCHALNSQQCVVFANIAVSQNASQKIDFDSIRFSKKNRISIFDSIIVTSVKHTLKT